jgi:MraZ protein
MKLPVSFKEYLEDLPDKKLFMTTLDEQIAHLYPAHLWRKNEEFLRDFVEDPDQAEDLLVIAYDLGAESEMDKQGRVLIPSRLRKHLGLDGENVHLLTVRGRIDIYSEDRWEQRKKQAKENSADKIRSLRRKGFI